MASIRGLKKDIEYLVGEVIADCYLAIYFHPAKQAEYDSIVNEAIALHNTLISRAQRPDEKNNPRLVKKYYTQIRHDMFAGVDALFSKLSDICKKN